MINCTKPYLDKTSDYLSSTRLQKLISLNSKRTRNFFEVVNRDISHPTLYMSYERPVKSGFES